ncbi:MAG: hypothetical protein DBY00_05305 [Flavobacteriales bacterium]|nr:MAG: hypothetical protein DBY00_05305 [Flavobacteriales bacterium]
MRKKTFKVFLPIAVLGCVVSCSKMTSYQYGYDAHMTKENDIVKGQKTSFTAAHPSAGLDLNWETAGSYQWDDSSKAVLVCVRTSPGDYYFNYDATEFPESERHRYMHPSVWLTLYQDSLGRQYSTLTSAVGDTAYLKKAGIDAMYISPLNMMDFTGDLLFFDMSKKLLGRVGYTDGRIDTSRAPVKRGLLVPAVMVSQAQGGDGDEPPNPGSTTVPVWDGQDISTLDEVIIKGWLPVYNYDPVHFCSYFPEWCMVRPCPYCGDMDCNGTDCTAYVRDTTDTDPVPPVDPDPDPSGPGDGDETPKFPNSGQPVVDAQLELILEKMPPAERAVIIALLNKNKIRIFVKEPPTTILNKMAASGLDPTDPVKGWFPGEPGNKEYNLYISPAFYSYVSQNIPPVGLTLGLLHEIAHILLTEQGIHLDNHSQHVVMMGWFLQDMVEALFPGNTDAVKYGKFAGIYDTTEWGNLVKSGEYKDANKFFDKEKICYKNNPRK